MLSLFCSHLQFVIVSDQDIEKNYENFMSSWYLIWQTFEELAWQTFEEVALQKLKPNEDAIIYTYTHPHQVYLSTLAEMTCCQQFQFSS